MSTPTNNDGVRRRRLRRRRELRRAEHEGELAVPASAPPVSPDSGWPSQRPLTRGQVRAQLDFLGIGYDPKASVAKLRSLLAECVDNGDSG